MSTDTATTTARNASVADIAALLKDRHARRVDMVAPVDKIRADGGQLVIEGTEPTITEDGVTMADGTYTPTAVCDEGISDKLNIPRAYLRRMRDQAPHIYDANVNGWLDHEINRNRKFLVRGLRGEDGGGVARAFLTDSFKPIDDYDSLLAALDGIRQAGVEVQVDGCDLTDSYMRVRVVCEQVTALAPVLLNGYRSPFDSGVQRAGGWTLESGRAAAAREGLGYEPGTEPIVFAGFEISNSEVGKGAFQIAPRLVVQVCRNGLTITADALRAQHLGAKLAEGVIRWSDETNNKALALVTSQTRDAVRSFLDVDYITKVVGRLEEQAGAPVEDAAKAVELVSKKLRYSEEQQKSILDHFILGGQMTAGGVVNAVTSVAQTLADADVAAAMEADALRVLELVAAR